MAKYTAYPTISDRAEHLMTLILNNLYYYFEVCQSLLWIIAFKGGGRQI